MNDFMSNDGSFDLKSTANGFSVMLWGLVLAKAQQGFKASTSKDSTTVKSKISNISKLIGLIIGATLCKFVAESNFLESSVPEINSKKSLKGGRLQSSKNMPESFYDPSSSHYMGGAHNVALAKLAERPTQIKKAKTSRKTVKTPLKMVSDKSMHSLALSHVESGSLFASPEKKNIKSLSGTAAAIRSLKSRSAQVSASASKKQVKIPSGNHNFALASVAAQSKKTKETRSLKAGLRQNKAKNVTIDISKSSEKKQFNYGRAAKLAAFIFAAGASFSLMGLMKQYHQALRKQEQLTKLFNNPNARVAAGEQGKTIMKKLQAPKEKKVQKPKKVQKKVSNTNEDTLAKILKLLEDQQKSKQEKEST